MNKPTRVAVLTMAILAAGGAGVLAGLKVAAEIAFRNSILEAAQEVWTLERFRSISCRTPSPEEAEWMKLVIQSKENLLLDPEYRKWIDGDRTVQNYKHRVEALRRGRLPTTPSPEGNAVTPQP